MPHSARSLVVVVDFVAASFSGAPLTLFPIF